MRLFASLCVLLLSGNILAQENLFTGKVTDMGGNPLPGATIVVVNTNQATTSDADGNFTLKKMKDGHCHLLISFIGYKPQDIEVNLPAKPMLVKLEQNIELLSEVVVGDNYERERNKNESLLVEIVNKEEMQRNQGGSLMKSLDRLPGIAAISIGSGQSKPTVRGMGFNRVVVTENGVKHEGQQWGADHGLEIDQNAVDQVEIIKGPASLSFGSDAIGGVIDLKEEYVPSQHTLGSSINLFVKSNNDLVGTSVLVYGRKKDFFSKFRVTAQSSADYKVPTSQVNIYDGYVNLYQNRLRNTAGNGFAGHYQAGWTKEKWETRFFVSDVSDKSGFFANARGLEPRNVDTAKYDASSRDILDPYQTVNHFKATNQTKIRFGDHQTKIEAGYQNNYRTEYSIYTSHGYMPANYPDKLPWGKNMELRFNKNIYSANVDHQYKTGRYRLNVGLNSSYQDNKIAGWGFIIPAFGQFTIGPFGILRVPVSDQWMVLGGVRYDYSKINSSDYTDWFKTPVTDGAGQVDSIYYKRSPALCRNFNSFTWSFGANYQTSVFNAKINIGKSFRIPTINELASNGINYHYFRFEIGNGSLKAEQSYQADLMLQVSEKQWGIQISPFVNYFPNYIYLNPSSDFDYEHGAGNQKYYYSESRVFRFGGEISSYWQIIKPLKLSLAGDYVYSEQLSGSKKGFSLPFSPPPSMLLSLEYSFNPFGFFSKTYLSADYRIVGGQDRIVPPEKSTPGHQLVNLAAGSTITIRKQEVAFSFQVQNLVNAKYLDHTSYYRLIGLPEAGRNFILDIKIPFETLTHAAE